MFDKRQSMVLLRVQDWEGLGPYASRPDCDYETFHNRGLEVRHPTPYNDSRLRDELTDAGFSWSFDKDLRFAFASVDQFFSWFYSDTVRNKLKEFGFDLVLLVGCTKVFVGNTQCAVQGGEVVHTLDVTSSREVIEAAYMQATFKGE